jgi:HTH-type transcriptional regulator/antitoxin HigA
LTEAGYARLTEAGYKVALARIETIMDAKPGTPEGAELDALTDLVVRYEAQHEMRAA